MNKLLITFVLLSIPLSLFGQSEKEYEVVNRIINNDSSELKNSNIYFSIHTKLALVDKNKSVKDVLSWYKGTALFVLKDSLSVYRKKITKKKIKNAFVTWDNSKIDYSLTTTDDSIDFFCISKPIKLDRNLFLTIEYSYFSTSIVVYTNTSHTVEVVKNKVIRRVCPKFR